MNKHIRPIHVLLLPGVKEPPMMQRVDQMVHPDVAAPCTQTHSPQQGMIVAYS